MREIKFRGYGKDAKHWIYGSLLDERSAGIVAIQDEDCHVWEVEPESVGQYTGHYDEMGTELYEGDIVSGYFEEDEWPAVVEWDEVTASFVLEGQCSQIRFDEMGGLEIEIVGNIHDNPELLEAPND